MLIAAEERLWVCLFCNAAMSVEQGRQRKFVPKFTTVVSSDCVVIVAGWKRARAEA